MEKGVNPASCTEFFDNLDSNRNIENVIQRQSHFTGKQDRIGCFCYVASLLAPCVPVEGVARSYLTRPHRQTRVDLVALLAARGNLVRNSAFHGMCFDMLERAMVVA